MHGYVSGSFTQSQALQLPPKKSPNWPTKKASCVFIHTHTHTLTANVVACRAHICTKANKVVIAARLSGYPEIFPLPARTDIQHQRGGGSSSNSNRQQQQQAGSNNDNYQRQSLQWQPKLAITSEWWRYIIIDDVRVQAGLD